MNPETTIQLPPPRHPAPKHPGAGVWMLWVFAALVAGLAAGIFIGKQQVRVRSVVIKAPAPAADPAPAPVAPPAPAGLDDKLTAAALAANDGDWLRTQTLYREALALDPENAVARAALALVERHLATSRATVTIATVPPGASVKLGSLGEAKSPAVFHEVPYGTYQAEIALAGFQPVSQKITVDRAAVDLAGLALSRGTGALQLSSVPEGVEYKLVRADNVQDLVKIGKTPAVIESLHAGDYQVLMALQGWPEYREKVKVESNRNSSVSHIFARGGLKITSDPSGAEVWLTTDASLPAKQLGPTPLSAADLPVGRHRIESRYRDWPPIQRTVEVREGQSIEIDFAWKRGAVSFSSDPAGARVLLNDQPAAAANATPFTGEFPEGRHTFVAQYEGLDPAILEVEVKADAVAEARFAFAYGSVSIGSQPEGATVLAHGRPIGRTPYRQPAVKPGPIAYEVALPQHRTTTVSGEVKPGQGLNFDARLVFDPAPLTRSDFTNSLGLKMIWVDSLRGWIGAHEVPQRAYETLMRKNPSAIKGETLPAHGMTWYDATRFCDQLNAGELGAGVLPKGYRYALPSDQMWSHFAGEAGLDRAATSASTRRDGPAPGGSLPANEFGLFDTRGNVWEWCADWYSLDIVNRGRDAGTSVNASWAGTERKVLRGGSWARSSASDLHRDYRYAMRPSTADNHEIGFRVVLMPE